MWSNVARISLYVVPNKTTVYRTVACGGKTRSRGRLSAFIESENWAKHNKFQTQDYWGPQPSFDSYMIKNSLKPR